MKFQINHLKVHQSLIQDYQLFLTSDFKPFNHFVEANKLTGLFHQSTSYN